MTCLIWILSVRLGRKSSLPPIVITTWKITALITGIHHRKHFENFHRNVVFADGADEPFSRLISMNPENLWRWMDSLREQGMDSISIPIILTGRWFHVPQQTYDGQLITQSYTDLRMRNEPIVGDASQRHLRNTSAFVPREEFAAFEIIPIKLPTLNAVPKRAYVREAYLRGLALQRAGAGNPYKFGLIGASDTHVGAGAFDENNYWSKIGIVDASGKLRGSVALTWVERLGIR